MTGAEATQLLRSFSDAVTELVKSVSQSVVSVDAGRRSGTGIVWSRDGLVVTANHVVDQSEAPTVTFDGGREAPAKVLGRDPYTDVAMLKVDGEGLAPMEMGTVDDVKVGQFVLALANAPGGKASATSGIVTGHGRSMRGFWGAAIDDAVVSDAKLNPGYSGGPLVNESGRLLGMNVAYLAGRGIAISVDSLKEIVQRVSRDGKVRKGFLGVAVEPIELPEELAKTREVGQGVGLLVRVVEPGSPAKAAGLVMGDIILKLGDTNATDEYRLLRALSGEVVGKQVGLRILRMEKIAELEVTPREKGN